MKKLIEKLNNIERNVGWVERYYHLGGRVWFISKENLFVDGKIATSEEVNTFLSLKEAWDDADMREFETR